MCQFHLWRLLFVLFIVLLSLAGVQDLAILAGRIFELNSFHLGQDCPQSFLNLTPSIWVKCPHLSDLDLPSGASFVLVLDLDSFIWLCSFWGKIFLWLIGVKCRIFKGVGLKLLSSHPSGAYNERIHMVHPFKRGCSPGHASSFRLEGAELFAITTGWLSRATWLPSTRGVLIVGD